MRGYIAAGANVNKRAWSDAPIHVAARNGHAAAILALKTMSVDVNARDASGETPIFIAAVAGHAKAITALAQGGSSAGGADVNTVVRGIPAIAGAAQYGHVSAIKALEAAGAIVDLHNADSRQTPMHIAAAYGQPEAIRALHAAGVNMNDADRWGNTPVHLAAREGHAPSVVALKDVGADMNIRNEQGETPLYVAAYYGRTDAIFALVDAGAIIDTPSHQGKTPLHAAIERAFIHKKQGIIEKLLLAGANANGTMELAISSQAGEQITKLLAEHLYRYNGGMLPIYAVPKENPRPIAWSNASKELPSSMVSVGTEIGRIDRKIRRLKE